MSSVTYVPDTKIFSSNLVYKLLKIYYCTFRFLHDHLIFWFFILDLTIKYMCFYLASSGFISIDVQIRLLYL